MTVKTNSMRLLDSRKIAYEVYEYSAETHSAVEAAQAIGQPAERVFKTLVVMRETPGAKPLLVMVPGDRELDLRALAKSTGDKKLRMATQKEAESLTGLLVGGIGALALLNRGFEIWLDRAARAAGRERICVNAGQRGVMLELRVDDLVRVTNARWAEGASFTAEALRIESPPLR
jgi:Cys-tRNA(Pro)/Cys-tRNA(Cys) deacylase